MSALSARSLWTGSWTGPPRKVRALTPLTPNTVELIPTLTRRAVIRALTLLTPNAFELIISFTRRAVICAELETRFRAVIERLFCNRKTAFIIERLSLIIER